MQRMFKDKEKTTDYLYVCCLPGKTRVVCSLLFWQVSWSNFMTFVVGQDYEYSVNIVNRQGIHNIYWLVFDFHLFRTTCMKRTSNKLTPNESWGQIHTTHNVLWHLNIFVKKQEYYEYVFSSLTFFMKFIMNIKTFLYNLIYILTQLCSKHINNSV